MEDEKLLCEICRDEPGSPSLQTKRIRGRKEIDETRVDRSYRFTYHRLPGDVLELHTVGRHDETLRNS